MNQLAPKLDFQATAPVLAALASLGRTEDLRFSPDNRLLAIAGFGLKRCLILRIDIETAVTGPRISVSDHMEITSDAIGSVHGIDFIDNRTLAVANRDRRVSILRLPPGDMAGRSCAVAALRQIRGRRSAKLETPGSLAVRRHAGGFVSLLVCNNWSNKVTRHLLDGHFYRSWRNQVHLRRGLELPDGIALSDDGQWIAISSHDSNDVKLFDASGPLGAEAEPAGVLLDANYPHGLRFTADGRHILVADAGSPVVSVYDRAAGWAGSRTASRRVVVLDDATFARGRSNPQEGGPKGLDIDRSNTVVAITCEEEPLAFFPLAAMVGGA